MGKTTGFLEYKRSNNKIIEVKNRIKNYEEFYEYLKAEDRILQGARCMNCGVPMCQSALELKGMVTGCPLNNLIPEWNDEIYNNNIAHAYARLIKTNPFPEFTGRVCPALCEKACINGVDDEPVTVHENELYIIESAFKDEIVKPAIPSVRTKYKVAVIGSGPAGLACATRLNQRGHNVTVYEKDDRIGGLLMYGIPNMKLNKKVIFRREELLVKEGITFKKNTELGKDITAKELLNKFDAVVLACGSKKPRQLNVDTSGVSGIHYAVNFLTSTTKSLLDNNLIEGTYISAKNKHVVIVGGGDTGNDCVGTCIRHGCKSVTQIEMMPKSPVERAENNKWPEWPKVLKTDYGQKEAIEVFGQDPRIYNTTIKDIIQKDGQIKAVVTVKVQFKDGKLEEIAGSEKELPCDLLIIAAGFVGCQDNVLNEFKLTPSKRGTIIANDKYMTDVPKVFTAGDCHRGQSLVVWAIKEGRECAIEVDAYLNKYTNME